MKKINILITILVFSFLSCGEGYLDLDPIAQNTEANFYQTEEQMFQALVGVYDVISWTGTAGWTMNLGLLTAASDETFAGGSDRSDQPSWVAWDEFTLTSEIGPQSGFWEKYYAGIGRANVLLEKIEESEGLDQALMNRFVAETKFLRAYYYFELVRLFGDVPLIISRIGPDAAREQVRTPKAQVYAQIESDLLAAYNEPGIPEVPISSEIGRITKGAVTAMLGKTLMYSGDDSRFLDAAAYLEEVINSGNYSLESNFEDIFRYDNEWNSESIWEIQYSAEARAGWDRFGNGSEGNYTTQFIGMREYTGPTSSQYDGPSYATGWSFCPVSLDLVDFMKNDPRYRHTIIDGNQLKNLGAAYTPGFQNTDYFLRKYAPVEDFRAPDGEPALNWSNNERVIRLADVLLMAAECLVRGGGDEGQATAYVNRIRSRVSLQPISNSGQSLLDAIYRERRMELATEGHRFFDLVRTGQAAQFLPDFVEGKHEVLPIPQSEIDLTQGSLIQNPGY